MAAMSNSVEVTPERAEDQAIAMRQTPESTQPESAEKDKKEEQVLHYTVPLQDALKEYVNVDHIPTSKSGQYVGCLVESREVTDFASFVKNVFYFKVRGGNETVYQHYYQQLQDKPDHSGRAVVAKCNKILDGKGEVNEVRLGLDPDFGVSVNDLKVLMVDCYGKENLTLKANRNPQLLNARKVTLSKKMSEPQKSERGVSFLKQAWKDYEAGNSVPIKRLSVDPEVDKVTKKMGATSLSS